MAVKVQWEADGPFAICDTPAEAMELLRQARSSTNGGGSGKGRAPASKEPSTDNMETMFNSVNDKGKKMLKLLLDYPQGIEGEQFSKACGIDSSGFGGVLGSLSKAARKANLNIDQFVQSEPRFEGKRRYRWFAPTKLLTEQRHRL
jgi:hypothetical protein